MKVGRTQDPKLMPPRVCVEKQESAKHASAIPNLWGLPHKALSLDKDADDAG